MSARKKPQPEPGVGKAVVESFRFHGRIYELRKNSCGKKNCTVCDGSRPAHGPYWYVCISRHGRWRRVYIGKDLDTAKFVNDQGLLEIPTKKDRPIEPCPTPEGVIDEPGQGLLFDGKPDPPDPLWHCPKCSSSFSLTATVHTVLVNLLLARHRCPFCRAAVDVSAIAAIHTTPPAGPAAPTVPVLFRAPPIPALPTPLAPPAADRQSAAAPIIRIPPTALTNDDDDPEGLSSHIIPIQPHNPGNDG